MVEYKEKVLMQVPGYFCNQEMFDKLVEIYGPITNMVEFCYRANVDTVELVKKKDYK